jgi:NADPH:quinone reductase-like Zn-dependent oxidoreductase
MKAAVYKQYGPPQVVQIAELPQPVYAENELLIQVHASTVNRTDAGFRSAQYFISRFWSGLFRPKFPVLGCEFAGEVVEVGAGVTLFRKGDRVFGYNDSNFGGHAEYIVMHEAASLALLPAGWTFEAAAPLTEGAHYALSAIRAAGVVAGQRVMVYGATGAIGSAAVQMLKSMGVQVTAVCGNRHIGLVRSLGADQVIDYQTGHISDAGGDYHFIFDAVGKISFRLSKSLLHKKGIYISTELGKHSANIWLSLLTPLGQGKRVKFPFPVMSKSITEEIRQLAERGLFTPVIDRKFPLADIVDAYTYVEQGQKTGNVILSIRE